MSVMQAFIGRERISYILAICFSLLISAWMTFNADVINPDAVCYLSAASVVGEQGVHGAMQLCGQASWPFYSILIYQLAHISHVSYQAIAYLLNALFSALSVLTFMLIVKTLGGTKRIVIIAAATILLAHEFNAVREYIVRDHGFWAFYLLSFYFLLRYFNSPTQRFAILFNLSLLVATLFRIEGIFFLAALPLLAFFYQPFSMKQRFYAFLQLNTLNLGASFFVLLWFAMHPQQTLAQMGRLVEIPEQLQHGLSIMYDRYVTAKSALAQHVLTTDSVKEAGLIMIGMMVAWYIMSVIMNITLPYAFMVIYAWSSRLIRLTPASRLVLWGYVFTNVAITFLFLLERFFLSKRYLIALSLVLMLWVPFVLDYLWQQRDRLRDRILLIVLILWMVIAGVHSIFDRGYSKAYISDAGRWIAANVPESASLYANDVQLMYYTHHFGAQLFTKEKLFTEMNVLAKNQWQQFDYLALRVNDKDENNYLSLINHTSLIPIKSFQNKRHDQVVVYRVAKEE